MFVCFFKLYDFVYKHFLGEMVFKSHPGFNGIIQTYMLGKEAHFHFQPLMWLNCERRVLYYQNTSTVKRNLDA